MSTPTRTPGSHDEHSFVPEPKWAVGVPPLEAEKKRGDTMHHNRSEAVTVPGESWRELARRIQREADSRVLSDLVQELITKLDEEVLRKGLRQEL